MSATSMARLLLLLGVVMIRSTYAPLTRVSQNACRPDLSFAVAAWHSTCLAMALLNPSTAALSRLLQPHSRRGCKVKLSRHRFLKLLVRRGCPDSAGRILTAA